MGDIKRLLTPLLEGSNNFFFSFFFLSKLANLGKITLRVTKLPDFYRGLLESDPPRNHLTVHVARRGKAGCMGESLP